MNWIYLLVGLCAGFVAGVLVYRVNAGKAENMIQGLKQEVADLKREIRRRRIKNG